MKVGFHVVFIIPRLPSKTPKFAATMKTMSALEMKGASLGHKQRNSFRLDKQAK